jgi:ABC-type nickel/cobalt efflux system permease component RcnA
MAVDRPHVHHTDVAVREPEQVVMVAHHQTPHAHSATTVDQGSESVRVTSRRTLAALGIAGGVVPSPSALLVLLGTAAVGRAWWGVALVVAFGVGMAVTLGVAGLLAWRIGERVRRWAALGQRRGAVTLARTLPVIAAAGVCGAGVLVVARSAMPLL